MAKPYIHLTQRSPIGFQPFMTELHLTNNFIRDKETLSN
jgi:hypothetical protein